MYTELWQKIVLQYYIIVNTFSINFSISLFSFFASVGDLENF